MSKQAHLVAGRRGAQAAAAGTAALLRPSWRPGGAWLRVKLRPAAYRARTSTPGAAIGRSTLEASWPAAWAKGLTPDAAAHRSQTGSHGGGAQGEGRGCKRTTAPSDGARPPAALHRRCWHLEQAGRCSRNAATSTDRGLPAAALPLPPLPPPLPLLPAEPAAFH